MYSCCLKSGSAPPLQGSNTRVSGSTLTPSPASFLPASPPLHPPKSWWGRATRLTFQTGQLKPHVGASVGLWREERLVCIGHVWPGPHPRALMGAQQEAVGRETTASRSRCLLTTSGLHLLKAESVLAEKTFRRLKAKYTGGRLRSTGKVKVRAWSGADEAEPTPFVLSF